MVVDDQQLYALGPAEARQAEALERAVVAVLQGPGLLAGQRGDLPAAALRPGPVGLEGRGATLRVVARAGAELGAVERRVVLRRPGRAALEDRRPRVLAGQRREERDLEGQPCALLAVLLARDIAVEPGSCLGQLAQPRGAEGELVGQPAGVGAGAQAGHEVVLVA